MMALSTQCNCRQITVYLITASLLAVMAGALLYQAQGSAWGGTQMIPQYFRVVANSTQIDHADLIQRGGNATVRDPSTALIRPPPSGQGSTHPGAAAQKPPCSPAVFRQHFLTEGYFPSTGHWTATEQFVPDLCDFYSRAPIGKSIVQCFALNNITSIVIVGASQGLRYFNALIRYIKNGFPKCKTLKVENQKDRMPDKLYFADGREGLSERLTVDRRACSRCAAQKTVCSTVTANQSVTVEYLGMDHLVDSTVRLAVDGIGPTHKAIETYQEFLFFNYLPRHPPDLIIVNPAANHAKFNCPPAKFALDIAYFQGLIRMSLPNTTRTVWIPGMGEHEEAKGRNPNYKNLLVDGLNSTTLIDKLNHALFDALKKDYLDPGSGVMGFMDLVQLTGSCPKHWWLNGDGVHMSANWYKVIMEYLMKIVCGMTA